MIFELSQKHLRLSQKLLGEISDESDYAASVDQYVCLDNI
jgi:hypothetical protein